MLSPCTMATATPGTFESLRVVSMMRSSSAGRKSAPRTGPLAHIKSAIEIRRSMSGSIYQTSNKVQEYGAGGGTHAELQMHLETIQVGYTTVTQKDLLNRPDT